MTSPAPTISSATAQRLQGIQRQQNTAAVTQHFNSGVCMMDSSLPGHSEPNPRYSQPPPHPIHDRFGTGGDQARSLHRNGSQRLFAPTHGNLYIFRIRITLNFQSSEGSSPSPPTRANSEHRTARSARRWSRRSKFAQKYKFSGHFMETQTES